MNGIKHVAVYLRLSRTEVYLTNVEFTDLLKITGDEFSGVKLFIIY